VRQARLYPPDPFQGREGAAAMPATVVIAATKPADEAGAVLFVQEATASIAVRTAEPRSLPTFAHGPLVLKRHDLCPTVVGDGDLGPAQTTRTEHGVIFQQQAVGPFSPGTCSKGCNHKGERNLCSRAVYTADFDISPSPYLNWLRSLTALALCWSASAVSPPVAKTATARRSSAN